MYRLVALSGCGSLAEWRGTERKEGGGAVASSSDGAASTTKEAVDEQVGQDGQEAVKGREGEMGETEEGNVRALMAASEMANKRDTVCAMGNECYDHAGEIRSHASLAMASFH